MVPAPLAAAYSEVGLQLQLASASDGEPCAGSGCLYARGFDRQVQRLASRLSAAAFADYPELQARIDKFEFIIADKSDPGATSSAAGKVVIYGGMRTLRLDEEALAFIIAREMGHVIARHHDENSAVSILFSVLAQVLLPVANIARGAAAIIQSNTMAAATATTAASYAGSWLVKSSTWDEQSAEADSIALSLLRKLGWSRQEVSDALAASFRPAEGDNWLKELRVSARRCEKLAEQPLFAATQAAQQEAPGIH